MAIRGDHIGLPPLRRSIVCENEPRIFQPPNGEGLEEYTPNYNRYEILAALERATPSANPSTRISNIGHFIRSIIRVFKNQINYLLVKSRIVWTVKPN